MASARRAGLDDFDGLVALFSASEVSAVAEPPARARAIWAETLADPNVTVFVSAADGQIVASCMLVTAPNLLRQGRRHGFLENVVTHPDKRGRGHGQTVEQAALAAAWAADCHHVLLQSGRPDARVHRFYERNGFRPGLRTAYVAMRPAES